MRHTIFALGPHFGEPLDKLPVLLVDDNEATCTLVTALLQREFAVEVATDGLDAVELLRTKHYAAILLDLRMPQLDGYGVLDFLKSSRPEVLRHVLILTAALSPQELDRVRAYDIAGVVGKPFDVEALAAAVRRCAGTTNGRGPFFSGGMILLLAEVLRNRWMM